VQSSNSSSLSDGLIEVLVPKLVCPPAINLQRIPASVAVQENRHASRSEAQQPVNLTEYCIKGLVVPLLPMFPRALCGVAVGLSNTAHFITIAQFQRVLVRLKFELPQFPAQSHRVALGGPWEYRQQVFSMLGDCVALFGCHRVTFLLAGPAVVFDSGLDVALPNSARAKHRSLQALRLCHRHSSRRVAPALRRFPGKPRASK
jgi:hypothetical protein